MTAQPKQTALATENLAAVELDGVRLALGDIRFAFDGRIPAGRITAVTGPSGSGKSTLLNLIAGFEMPDAGRVRLAGQDVTRLHPGARPLSLVFQDHNLFAHLDLFTNIGLGVHPALKLTGEDRTRISAALQRVGLAGYEGRKPGTLSGGERQRAAFARALVRQRPLLLLDEPFAALDPGLRLAMADLLSGLHQETGASIVLVTHDPGEVMRLADEVIYLSTGKILFHGDRHAFCAQTAHPEISKFVASS
ncbi:ATP-binding cassette domain-containing protein [Rhizobium straminoryzae]|uniref:ATP-binding cassette domain-containing protein n=1 Tax=Rhizobium straminoryzae TaxID=1387186 RepID=A0A549T586_9HYPH|nr:ATP-binding cassette domain-containing protein [Rhizobium straminoryzae]TRL37027.1 ATP-binding cassette domain-containing protein [Rhizobium straminoryzae]